MEAKDVDKHTQGHDKITTEKTQMQPGVTGYQIKQEKVQVDGANTRDTFYGFRNFWVPLTDNVTEYIDEHRVATKYVPENEAEIRSWDGVVVNPGTTGGVYTAALTPQTVRAGLKYAFGEYRGGFTIDLLRRKDEVSHWVLRDGEGGAFLFDYTTSNVNKTERIEPVIECCEIRDTKHGQLQFPIPSQEWMSGFEAMVNAVHDHLGITLDRYIGPRSSKWNEVLYEAENGDTISFPVSSATKIGQRTFAESVTDLDVVGDGVEYTVGRGNEVDMTYDAASDNDTFPITVPDSVPEDEIPEIKDKHTRKGDTTEIGGVERALTTKSRVDDYAVVLTEVRRLGLNTYEAESENVDTVIETLMWTTKSESCFHPESGETFQTRDEAESFLN